jgi:uncharacterized protein with HEPN domain
MSDRDIKALKRIIFHIENILDYVKSIHSLEDFTHNQLVVDAVVFNLAQIGEISKHRVSSILKDTQADVPWHEMYGFRNRIIHDYDQINMNIVYDTIKEDLPLLLEQLRKLISLNK